MPVPPRSLPPRAYLAVPEHARALLRAWSGRDLFPRDWADDVAATYLSLRLELAERRTGLELIDPTLRSPGLVLWHLRRDPGADLLASLTGSPAYEREVDRELEREELPLDWGAAHDTTPLSQAACRPPGKPARASALLVASVELSVAHSTARLVAFHNLVAADILVAPADSFAAEPADIFVALYNPQASRPRSDSSKICDQYN